MMEGVQRLIDKGRRSLEAARQLLIQGHYDFAVSRAYYAMFYIAEAVLLCRGLAYSRHRGVISAFGEHFVKTGVFPKRLHQLLTSAFDERNVADYACDTPFPKEEAESIVRNAEELVTVVEHYPKSLNTGN